MTTLEFILLYRIEVRFCSLPDSSPWSNLRGIADGSTFTQKSYLSGIKYGSKVQKVDRQLDSSPKWPNNWYFHKIGITPNWNYNHCSKLLDNVTLLVYPVLAATNVTYYYSAIVVTVKLTSQNVQIGVSVRNLSILGTTSTTRKITTIILTTKRQRKEE